MTRVFPHTPGIDAAGVVLESRDKDFTGDEVIVIIFDLGMGTLGCRTDLCAGWLGGENATWPHDAQQYVAGDCRFYCAEV